MSQVSLIWVGTIIGAIFFALLLVYVARMSSQVKVSGQLQRKVSRYADTEVEYDGDLKESVFNQVSQIVGSKRQSDKISKSVLDVLNKEVDKKVAAKTDELNKKHQSVLQEKTEHEEMAWQKYDKMLSEKQNTDAVMRSIAEGLVVVDAKGNVMMMNPSAEKLLGVEKGEKVGKSMMEGLKGEQLVTMSKNTPDKKGREIEVISEEDETKKILRASSAVIEDENGETIGFVSVLSDITKQKELDQLKSDFVGNVSHELRTPLVAIQKSISLLFNKQAGEINETQEQFLAMADRNLKRLTLLINDLLDLSKFEAGKMQVKCESEYIDGVIDEAMETMKTWAETKSITVEKKISPAIPEVYIDHNRIIQVLTNLIGNAVKFTPNNGKITVSADADKNKGFCEISIKDTGIGISPDALGKVFDKFQQVGERAATDIAGTGLGLSICKEIVEIHGGNIWAESDGKNGTKFCFTVQLR